jgi:hypothetical protein
VVGGWWIVVFGKSVVDHDPLTTIHHPDVSALAASPLEALERS